MAPIVHAPVVPAVEAKRFVNAGERILSFRPALCRGRRVDGETGTQWDPWTGVAVAGALHGAHLGALPGIVTFTHVWRVFHPESSFFGEKPRGKSGR